MLGSCTPLAARGERARHVPAGPNAHLARVARLGAREAPRRGHAHAACERAAPRRIAQHDAHARSTLRRGRHHGDFGDCGADGEDCVALARARVAHVDGGAAALRRRGRRRRCHGGGGSGARPLPAQRVARPTAEAALSLGHRAPNGVGRFTGTNNAKHAQRARRSHGPAQRPIEQRPAHATQLDDGAGAHRRHYASRNVAPHHDLAVLRTRVADQNFTHTHRPSALRRDVTQRPHLQHERGHSRGMAGRCSARRCKVDVHRRRAAQLRRLRRRRRLRRFVV